MTYNPNTPLASERISDTQEPIRLNFDLANQYFGVDHFAFDAASNNGKHRRVTMPDQTATPPSPAAGECAMYGKTISAVTTPFLRRDGLASPEYPVTPIRAYGSFTGGAATVNAINMTCAKIATGIYTLTLTAGSVTGVAYGVLIGVGINAPNLLGAPRAAFYRINTATDVTVWFGQGTPIAFFDPDFFTAQILQV
jgi:hypothetical protein